VRVFEGSSCPQCGGALDRSAAAFDNWEKDRARERIVTFMQHGLMKRRAGERAIALLDKEPRAQARARTLAGTPTQTETETQTETQAHTQTQTQGHAQTQTQAAERAGDAVASAVGGFFDEIKKRSAALGAAIDANAPRVEDAIDSERTPDSGRDDTALDAGRAMFAREGHAVVGAGIDALSSLDDAPDSRASGPESAKPLGALQAFWFIGTILVLAGSVMGVREAWRSLEGVTRQIVIGGALFVYHVLFVGLSRVLARRSSVTGRVLAGIAAGLLPVAFVAVASAIGTRASAGIPFALVLLVASAVTLTIAGRAFADGARGGGLSVALSLVPALAMELPLAREPTPVTLRLAMPFVALVPVLLSTVRLRARSTIVAIAASSYGAAAVALLAVFGGPLDDALDLSSGAPAQLLTTTWLGAFGAIGWWTAFSTAKEWKRSIVLLLLSLALVVGAASAGAISALTGAAPSGGLLGLAPAGLCFMAAAIAAIEQRRHLGAIHLVTPMGVLAVFLFARVALAQESTATGLRGVAALPASTVLVPAVLIATSTFSSHAGRRRWAAAWGVFSSLVILAITFGVELSSTPFDSFGPGTVSPPLRATAFVAGAIALSAHAGGRTQRPWLHAVGAIGALVAACAFVVPTRTVAGLESAVLVCAALGAAYGVLALPYATMFARKDDPRRPLDDVSLLLGAAGLVLAFVGGTAIAPFSDKWAAARALVPRAMPVLLVAALFFARSFRDASAAITALGACALVFALRIVTQVGALGEIALLAGLASLGAMAVSALSGPRPTDAPRWGRAIGGVIPLPFGASGFRLLQGFGLAAVVFATIAGWTSVLWIANPARFERSGVVFGMLATIGAALAAFGTRGLERLRARGNVVTLVVGGAAIAICAICNRIGRPLPPAVVGRNLTVVVAGVWIVARLFVRYGPTIADKLERPSHGSKYHFVPHAGVLAISLLLLVDAWIVGAASPTRFVAVTPPMLLFGGALGMLLLYRSSGLPPFLHVALGSLLGFAALVGAARAVFVAPLQALLLVVVPGTEDATWSRALFGATLFAVACASLVLAQSRAPAVDDFIARRLFDRKASAPIHTALSLWACIGALALGLNLALQPATLPALLLSGAGIALVLARGHDQLGSAYRAIVVVVGAPLVVHALATSAPSVPAWAGPAMAALPLLIAFSGAVAARRRERGLADVNDTELGIATLVATFYSGCALAYALAAGGPTNPRSAAAKVFDYAADTLSRAWTGSTSTAVTLGLIALSATCTAATWRGGLAKILGVLPPLLLALAAMSGVSGTVMMGAGIACAALVAHAGGVVSARAQRDDLGTGLGVGRDVVLVAVLATISAFVLGRAPDSAPVAGLRVGPAGVLALGVSIIVCIDAAVRTKTSRHVMLVEIFVVALYAFATRELGLRPEIHAILGLGYGFTLLGVAVIARRNDIHAVSAGTRRVAAALPLLVAWLTASGVSDTLAMLAFGSSLLYGAMAMVERSRIFGSLAAVAANVALLVFALAQGLDGIEIYVGPLGLLVTALSQLFASKMNAGARGAARVLGGVLLYLPAGVKLTFGLGAAADGTYSVVFGAVCLLGVVAGLVLRVRAYLALGTLFLTLDVVANLVNAGLRDHRVGFVLLSTAGLFILGIMILVTLRRDAARALLQSIRGRFRRWD
jgi:hypothetical protein